MIISVYFDSCSLIIRQESGVIIPCVTRITYSLGSWTKRIRMFAEKKIVTRPDSKANNFIPLKCSVNIQLNLLNQPN